MATEKTALDYVNDFFEGFYDTAVNAPIALGDFLARISGYRDYQFTKDSVLDLDSDLYQKQALNELKQKAYEQGGNAVIGVKIEHTYNNANSGSILSVMATGTVVKLKN